MKYTNVKQVPGTGQNGPHDVPQYITEDGRKVLQSKLANWPAHYDVEIFLCDGKPVSDAAALKRDWFFFILQNGIYRTIQGDDMPTNGAVIYGAGETPEAAEDNGRWIFNEE